MSVKNKLKITLYEFNQHWLILAVGIYIGVAFTLWLLFFYGFGVLGIAISFSFIAPLIFLGIYYIRNLDNRPFM